MQGWNKSYTDEVVKFAFTLSGYSSKAYNYVRKTFWDALPCVKTINLDKNTFSRHINKRSPCLDMSNFSFSFFLQLWPYALCHIYCYILFFVLILLSNKIMHCLQGQSPDFLLLWGSSIIRFFSRNLLLYLEQLLYRVFIK